MVAWPEDIRFICEKSAIIGGGFEYDGKELAPLDEAAARDFFAQLKGVEMCIRDRHASVVLMDRSRRGLNEAAWPRSLDQAIKDQLSAAEFPVCGSWGWCGELDLSLIHISSALS